MRTPRRLLAVTLLAAAPLVHAESKDPADYPLRVHIINRSQTSFYHRRVMEEAKGEGHLNLFAGGEVRGVDFTYDCWDKVHSSTDYQTYPARWKKPGQELVVLLPVFGKTGQFETCHMKTDVKDYAYATHAGSMHTESPEQFKRWMVAHDYDPEHGKDEPVRPQAPAEAQPTKPTGAPQP